MDSNRNPFAPGAGNQPPEMAGRERVMEELTVALQRVKQGRSDRSRLLLGLRGVGKTVLLNRLDELASRHGYETLIFEAPEERGLPEMLVPKLRSLLVRLSRVERAKTLARRALGVLRAFAAAFRVSVGDVEFGVEAEPGTADSGDLESDLPELFLAVGMAAQEAEAGVALLLDEVQYLSSEDLSALIVAMHRISQKNLPVLLVGAGLPQLAGLAGEAKSYAERLFRYPEIGPLSPDAAAEAIRAPVEREGAQIEDEALERIVHETEGYPYFLQEWGFHAWDEAAGTPISSADVERASVTVLAHLDQDFFKVRFDRLTQREKEYLRAMAELGPGPYRSGEIAELLGTSVTTAASLRDGLIKKGMIYSRQHGLADFTVPMFDAFMRRTMPKWRPASGAKKARSRAS